MARKIRDSLTLDLFDIPTPTPPLAGNLDLDVALRYATACEAALIGEASRRKV